MRRGFVIELALLMALSAACRSDGETTQSEAVVVPTSIDVRASVNVPLTVTSVTARPAFPSCPEPSLKAGTNPTGDFVDFVKLDGVTYVSSNPRRATLTDAVIGEQIATVCQSYRTRVYSGPARDGDAAYLDEGAPIYSVNGYSTRFRVASRRFGELTLYEADTNPAATVGRDLIDLSQSDVQTIAINSATDGIVTIARIDDPRIIDRLVELMHRARVDQRPHDHSGSRYFLEFQLADGTSVNRSLWMATGEYHRGILLPKEFTDTISAAIR